MSIARLDDHRSPAALLPMPANVELEQALLGAVLINNDAFHAACTALTADHFHEELHQRIFDVIAATVRDGRLANPVTLGASFGSGEIAPGVTVARYLARLCAEATTVIRAPAYAAELIALAGRRKLIAIADETRAAALDPPAGAGVDHLLDDAEEQLAQLRSSAPTQVVTRGSAGAFADALLDEVDDLRAGAIAKAGVTTGVPELDRDTGGFMPGTLWIVAGRPGMGKTIMATNLARAAARSGAGTMLFSLEVPRKQLTARVLTDLSYIARKPIPYGRLLQGEADEEDMWRLRDAARRLAAMPLILDCASRLTVAQIASRMRAERLRLDKLGVKLGVVLIDYLKFVNATDRYAGQRHYEVGEISGALKALAKDMDLAVVLLAQLNRQVEGRLDRRPDLPDLRESGDLEADADVVAFVYRDAYYIERSAEYRKHDPDAISRAIDAQNQLEFIVGKNRAGQTRTHDLWVDIACSTVSAHRRDGI